MNIPNLPGHELYARVQLDAAIKNVDDCQEREKIAFDAYMEAIEATMDAWQRDYDARQAWRKAIKAVEEVAEEPTS